MASCVVDLDLLRVLSAGGEVGLPCVGDGAGRGTLEDGMAGGASTHDACVWGKGLSLSLS